MLLKMQKVVFVVFAPSPRVRKGLGLGNCPEGAVVVTLGVVRRI